MQYLPVTAYYIFLWQNKRFDEKKHKISFRNEVCNTIKRFFFIRNRYTNNDDVLPKRRNVTTSCKILLNRKYDKLKKLH